MVMSRPVISASRVACASRIKAAICPSGVSATPPPTTNRIPFPARRSLAPIVNSSHDAIISKGLNGIILSWNGGAERLFGYPASEAIGKFIGIIIPPDRLSEEPQILARIRSGELVDHFDTVRRRKDGSMVQISLTVSPVRDENDAIIGASKIARDISERKAMEIRLRESELRIRSLLDAIPAALFTTDERGNISYFNQGAMDYAYVPPKIGATWQNYKLYRPDGSAISLEHSPTELALKEGRSIRNQEVLIEKADGTRVPIIPYATPVIDAEGEVFGSINIAGGCQRAQTS